MNALLPDATERRCPRCGSAFACGASSGVCECMGLALSPAQRVALAERYPGQCLCLRCLQALGAARPPDARPSGRA